MLTAYFDESGSSEDEKELVLAGYVQRAPLWELFSDAWQAVLDQDPKIEYFHMSEAESKKGVFDGWEQKDIRQKTSDLADVIVEYELWSVECRVSMPAFRNILEPIAPFDLKNPYVYLFAGIIDGLARLHAHSGIESPVDVVMDKHTASPFVIGLYPALKAYLPPGAAEFLGDSPIFRDDKKILPLQAADMLVWHLRRSREARNARERRRVHTKLLPVMHASISITSDMLKHMATEMNKVAGLSESQGRRGSIVLPPLPPIRKKLSDLS